MCFTDVRFRDSVFPPTAKSIGGSVGSDASIEWLRASDICRLKTASGLEEPQLFSGRIEPSDIAQGQLGDCWLLSSFAALAEKKGEIDRLFKERTASPVRNNALPGLLPMDDDFFVQFGKYHVRLFNGRDKRWETVIIDDLVPTRNGNAIFTQPKGPELWVLLLEKVGVFLVIFIAMVCRQRALRFPKW